MSISTFTSSIAPALNGPVAAANRMMHHERKDQAAAERSSLCPFLSSSWRQTMRQRSLTQAEPHPSRRQFEDIPRHHDPA
ncbi:MAG: hypothetical protein M3M98_04255 [Nitrospirota bacterium]|nr:hypothetical protein [Nitrospirota bacterium]